MKSKGRAVFLEYSINTTQKYIFLLCVLTLYVTLRLLAWQHAILLEDHDSVRYLQEIKNILTFDIDKIFSSNPDSTPFYPIFSAICSLPGWSVESGARFCSFLFDLSLFFTVIGIGKKFADDCSALIGLTLLSLCPVLVFLSIGILTEPSYIALVYIGFWIFCSQYDRPHWKWASFTGIIFGLAFLNRTEGIVYFVALPFFQVLHFFIVKERRYGHKQLITWIVLFVVNFSLLAVPQIIHVSYRMGQFAINGRQAWIKILDNPDGKNYDEKIYGLDYRADLINLNYLQEHPEVLRKFKLSSEHSTFFKKLIKKMYGNLLELIEKRIGVLIGSLGVILFIIGMSSLFLRGMKYESILIFLFLGFGLIGPLVHNVAMRHVVILAPMLFIVEGIGISSTFRFFKAKTNNSKLVCSALILVLLFHIATWTLLPLTKKYLRPKSYNNEYSPDDLKTPLSMINEFSRSRPGELTRITARKGYLAYYSDSIQFPLPCTSYQQLVTYCFLNKIDLVFLQHRLLSNYPFLEGFIEKNSLTEFKLLYRGQDYKNSPIELYLFKGKKT